MKRLPLVYVLVVCTLIAAPVSSGAEGGIVNRAAELPPGDLDCTGAVDLACGDNLQGDTSTGANNVSVYPCTPNDQSGPEDVYRIVLTEPTSIQLVLTPLLADDLDLFLLGDCNENFCIAASSTFPQPEIVVQCLAPGTYYAVVDGFEGAAGPYTLSLQCTECIAPVPANDICGTAEPLGCGTIEIETNTVGAADNYTPGDEGNPCTGFQAEGPDIVFEVFIPAGGTVQLQFTEETYDGSIYLVTDCNDIAGTCLAGGDCFPFPCDVFVNYFNDTGVGFTAFLIVDGFNPTDQGLGTITGTVTCAGACCLPGETCEVLSQSECEARFGQYLGDGSTCEPNPCPVPAELSTWGRVKSLYR